MSDIIIKNTVDNVTKILQSQMQDLETVNKETLVKAINEVKGLIPKNAGVGSKGEGTGAEIFNNYADNTAKGEYAHAEGWFTTASGSYSHAEGLGTQALGQWSHAEGDSTHAMEDCSHSGGAGTKALSSSSFSHGDTTIAGSKAFKITGYNSTDKTYTLDSVEGLTKGLRFSVWCFEEKRNYGNITAINTTNKAVTVDNYYDDDGAPNTKDLFYIMTKPELGTVSLGNCAFAEGMKTVASGIASHVEGKDGRAYGHYSHSEGLDTSSRGEASHAEGNGGDASGYASHAEGTATTASGDQSHAEGFQVTASGLYSHAEGTYTSATGEGSHAENTETIAQGNYSHAEGSGTQAVGLKSHSEGFATRANGENQHVQGRYNIADNANKYAHIVGNGTLNTKRSNAHTLDWDGNSWYQGNIKIGGTSYDDTEAKTVATEKTISTTVTDNNLVLSHNTDTRLTSSDIATLSLSLPTTIPDNYECYFSFKSGETATTLTYASNIRWVGADCDSAKTFVPIANVIYEVGLKKVGDDSEGNSIIVARVGVC